MAHPIVLLTDPRKEWARVVRLAAGPTTRVLITANPERLKTLVRSFPEGVMVIIDVRLAADATRLIEEVKDIHKNVVVLAATSSQTWEDTVAYIKSGAADVLFKTLDREQIRTYLQARYS